jgi:hypothetical protein
MIMSNELDVVLKLDEYVRLVGEQRIGTADVAITTGLEDPFGIDVRERFNIIDSMRRPASAGARPWARATEAPRKSVCYRFNGKHKCDRKGCKYDHECRSCGTRKWHSPPCADAGRSATAALPASRAGQDSEA